MNKYEALFEQDEVYNRSCNAEKIKQIKDNFVKAEGVIPAREHSRQRVARKKSILKNLAEKQQLIEETSQTKRNQSHHINRRNGEPEL